MKKPNSQGELVQGKMGNIDNFYLTRTDPEIQAPSPAWQPAVVQRARILARLRTGPTTIQALRDELRVVRPELRLIELRCLGFPILSRRLPSGMAEYHLVGREVVR